jgi:hypothetical protein
MRKVEGCQKRRRRGGEGWLHIWRLLFYKRKFVRDRNQGSGGSRRVTSELNSFIRWLMIIEEIILLNHCL